MSPAVPLLLSAGSSDQGFVRPNNEDRVYCDDARGIYLVIDGMGGHAAGERAAEIALERIRDRLERQTDSSEQRLREAITLANNAIYAAAQENAAWRGMACVLTVAVIESTIATIGHVGDSRLYRLHGGLIQKVTRDHSPVGALEDSGELTEDEAMRHPRRNEVFRDVGSQEHKPEDEDFIDIIRVPFDSASALLLCSDGLSDAIPSAQIRKIIEENAGDRTAAVRALIETATEAGKDNVSAVLVEGEKFASNRGKESVRALDRTPAPPRRKSGALAVLFFLGGLLLGAAAVTSWFVFLREKPARPPMTILVPSSGTISAALAQASTGDTIQIGPGTYAESIELRSGVILQAEPPGSAVIQGTVSADHITGTRLEALVISSETIGLDIRDSALDIARCELRGARKTGVRYQGASAGTLTASWLHENAGPGIVIEDSASPLLENNVLSANGIDGTRRPAIVIARGAHPEMLRNVFEGNGAEAVWLAHGETELVAKNYFIRKPGSSLKPFRLIGTQETAQ